MGPQDGTCCGVGDGRSDGNWWRRGTCAGGRGAGQEKARSRECEMERVRE